MTNCGLCGEKIPPPKPRRGFPLENVSVVIHGQSIEVSLSICDNGPPPDSPMICRPCTHAAVDAAIDKFRSLRGRIEG